MKRSTAGWAKWGIRHNAQIHYKQFRPINYNLNNLPWTGDCSAFSSACGKLGGQRDPLGGGYKGSGNSETAYYHLKHIAHRDVRRGDYAVLGPKGSEHMVVALQSGRRGRDFYVASHGSEAGPTKQRISVESAAFAGTTFLQALR